MQIALRYGRGDVDRMRANAAELVGLAPDAIIASGAAMVRIVQQQTQTIPIVISFAGGVHLGKKAWPRLPICLRQSRASGSSC
jgi:hypothetical protein